MSMTATRDSILTKISDSQARPHNKITVVGVGNVGTACAFTCLVQGLCNELSMVDVQEDKLKGEMLDFQHGLCFISSSCTIQASKDYSVTAGSKICVVTAGARQREGESRLILAQRNVDIFKGIIPELVKHSPNTILLIIANPVDVLTYVAWKLSGLPKERVIGSGTHLDSARFRYFIADRLGIGAKGVHGWIIGEHGDSSVPVWSGVNVGGVSLKAINPKMGTEESAGNGDEEKWHQLHKQVVQSGYEVIKLKGYTSWAIGLACASICKGILSNSKDVYALSINVKGFHGIKEDVYLSVPVVLSDSGVIKAVQQNLQPQEIEQLHKSAQTIHDVQSTIKFD